MAGSYRPLWRGFRASWRPRRSSAANGDLSDADGGFIGLRSTRMSQSRACSARLSAARPRRNASKCHRPRKIGASSNGYWVARFQGGDEIGRAFIARGPRRALLHFTLPRRGCANLTSVGEFQVWTFVARTYTVRTYCTSRRELAMSTAGAAREDRIELRATKEEKRLLATAAAYERLDVTSFIMRSVLPAARQVVDRAERIVLSERDTARVLELLENPPKPTSA